MRQSRARQPKDLITLEEALSAASDALILKRFLEDLLTPAEMQTLRHRWAAFQLLAVGATQRGVGDSLRISVATVSRAARVVQNKEAVILPVMKRAKAWRETQTK